MITRLVFFCTESLEGHPVRVELQTRDPEDPVFELARRRSISCPQCGRTMTRGETIRIPEFGDGHGCQAGVGIREHRQ